VIFHTAVLGYVAPAVRGAFAASVRDLCACWIANERPSTLPEIAAAAPAAPSRGGFLLAVNGVPRAWTDPHGGALTWIDGDTAG
jgi:hypothetical protein